MRLETKVHGGHDAAVRADLQALPAYLDIVDDWIADGVLGHVQPNAADLQIGSSLRFMLTIGDVRTLMAGRPAEELARRYFPTYPGDVPAGAYPSGWLPARA